MAASSGSIGVTFTYPPFKFTPQRWAFVLVFLVCVPVIWTQKACEEVLTDGQIIYSDCIVPNVFLKNIYIETTVEPDNSTCGHYPDNERNRYCHLWEQADDQCPLCDANDPALAHPPEDMTDDEVGDVTWWQSISWLDYQSNTDFPINVTFSFNKTFQIYDDIIFTFELARPQKMVLYKSTDYGATWQPYQFYARDCDDFNMPSKDISEIASSTEVYCTTQYSYSNPNVRSEVTFDVNTRLAMLGTDPEVIFQEFAKEEIQSFFDVTDLRLSLLYPATDGLEFSGSINNLRKYYYAISNVYSNLRCKCNQHASSCNGTSDATETVCNCQHNTAGRDCEKCLPLYNNRPWQAGIYNPIENGEANECEECNCYDHADSCYYNETLGHGVCEDCYHNTAGVFCDICIDGYFHNVTADPSSPDVCVLCECEPLGTIPSSGNSSNCAQYANEELGQPVGQCPCISLVQGRRCDECEDNFFGLLQTESPGICKACLCNLLGTVNASNVCEKEEGQCPCKANTGTRDCGECKDEYFLFPTSSEDDCLACNCDYGASVSFACNKVSGLCDCRPNIIGQRCNQVDEGSFFYEYLDSNSYDAWSAESDCEALSHLPIDYTGEGYRKCTDGNYILFENIMAFSFVSEIQPFQPVIRYSYDSASDWLLASLTVSVTGNTLQQDKLQRLTEMLESGELSGGTNTTNATSPAMPSATTCTQPIGELLRLNLGFSPGENVAWMPAAGSGLVNIDRRCKYDARLDFTASGSGSSTIITDGLLMMPLLEDFQVYGKADDELESVYDECRRNVSSVATVLDATQNPICEDLAFSVSAELNNGGVPCACNMNYSTSAECIAYGGQCTCKQGVYGQTCDRCQPGFYNLTNEGCTPCNCNVTGSSNLVCDFETGQCPCRDGVATRGMTDFFGGVAGLQCDVCQANYYGFDSGTGCTSCDCNTDGSESLQCDNSGDCLCKDTINGQKCSVCQEGYYDFSADGCKECECSAAGSVGNTCGAVDGVCSCKINVIGDKCDTCTAQTYNLQASNPDGCQRCYCFLHTSDCTHADNYVAAELSSNFLSSRLDGWSATTAAVIAPTQSGILVPVGPSTETVYLQAPAKYLGAKLSSYAQYLTFSAYTISGPLLTVMDQAVIIEGRNFTASMVYDGEPFNLTYSLTTFEILLHESKWKNMETNFEIQLQDFQAILADISSIKIRATFDTGVLAMFTSVTMDTSVPIENPPNGTEFSTGVEMCTCPTAQHVDGNSCGECETGYKRLNPAAGSYSTCVACECPPIDPLDPNPPTMQRAVDCDQDTGVCIECSSGSTGEFCEECKENVKTPDCDRCVEDHYGFGTDLFDGACAPCNCNTTGSGGATQCDNESGQCPCIGNYGGMQCDKCQDNYYDWAAGCVVCDDCYDVIDEDMAIVRELTANLTATVEYLSSQDNSTELGKFYIRLEEAYSEMVTLVDSINSAVIQELDLSGRINSLNNTMQILLTSLAGEIQDGVNASDVKVDQAAENVGVAEEAAVVTDEKITEAYTTLTSGSLEQAQVQLQALQLDLAMLETKMREATDATTSDVSQLEAEVASMTLMTDTARQTVTGALQTAQEAQLTHDNTTNRVSNLVTTAARVQVTSEDLDAQASDVLNIAQTTSDNAGDALVQAQTPNENANTDVIGLANSALVKIAQSGAIEYQGTEALENDIGIVEEVDDAANSTEVVLSEISSTIEDVGSQYQRSLTAHAQSTAAQDLSAQAFTAAEEMLTTLQNFNDIVSSVEETASQALSTVAAVEELSNSAKLEADAIQTGLADSKSHADDSLTTARQAFDMAEDERESIIPVHDRALLLEEEAANKLTSTPAMVESVNTINETQVFPQKAVCEGYNSTLFQLDQTVDEASELSSQAVTMSSDTKTDLDQLLVDLANIGTIDTSQLAAYQEQISADQATFTEASLVSTVNTLKAAVEEQDVWLERTRAELDSLQSQVDALESFRVTTD
ncbi:laminin subunit beta-1-like [Ptychodera flava]|uniref:laminin subunit beta-1-like n=1 Tax=Ptychodera flava TaxID=63121 RepID=UPI00396A40A7